jgi:hypothetical protein
MIRGHLVWSAERRLFLVCNLIDGVDVYQNLDPPVFIRKLPLLQPSGIKIKQSAFACSGRYAISGGDQGKVFFWSVTEGEIVQTLIHQEGRLVQIIEVSRELSRFTL